MGPDDDRSARWLVGGSYLVARRINMHIETWDRTSLLEQEAVIGRDKRHGAPPSGGDEFATPDFAMTGADSTPIVAVGARACVAYPDQNHGTHILRRGYNFTDGSNGLGNLDAGLFFIAHTRDPGKHFIPLQTSLARNDALSEYIQHTGSALFAVRPGVRSGGHIGQGLFET